MAAVGPAATPPQMDDAAMQRVATLEESVRALHVAMTELAATVAALSDRVTEVAVNVARVSDRVSGAWWQ